MTIFQKIRKVQFRLFFINLSMFLLTTLLFVYQDFFNVTEETEYYYIFESIRDVLISCCGIFGSALLTVNYIERELRKDNKDIDENDGDDSN